MITAMKKVPRPINENITPPYIDGNTYYVCPETGDNRTLIHPDDQIFQINVIGVTKTALNQ